MRYQQRGNSKSLRRPYTLFQTVIPVCVTLILAFLAISRTSSANEDHKTAGIDTTAESRTVKIGVLAKRGVERCQEQWGPTADYLTEQIPGYSFEVKPLGYDEVSATVEKGEVDFLLANSSFYVALEYLFGASRIVTLDNLASGKGHTVYGGVIFCRADRKDMRHLKDLKGKTFMAVKETSFGGWLAAWQELKKHGIDPYEDFASLSYGGTHDAVVYAVRDGKADAGTVRTDVLERMAMENRICPEDFFVFSHGLVHHLGCEFPFVHSTVTYPEWPFARARHTSDALAKRVTVALLEMSSDNPAAIAARCAGWTVPLNYQPVHECLKYLRVGPYKDYGKVTAEDVVREYWPWIAGIIVVVSMVIMVLAYVHKLNRRLSEALAITQDEVVERKRVEETLRESEEYSRTILESLPAGIAIIDAETKVIVKVNKMASDMAGAPPEDILGKVCHRHICPAEEGKCPITDMGQTVDNSDRILLNAKGENIPVMKTVLRVNLGGRECLIETFVDITERKRAEETKAALQAQLVQSEKLASVGQLSAGVAHEINNPIGFISSNLGTMKKYLTRVRSYLESNGGRDPDEQKEITEIVTDFGDAIAESIEGADRVKKIVADLKGFARTDSGKIEAADLNAELESTLNVVWNQIKYTCQVEKDLGELPRVQCHKGQINQVMLNLLVNAGQAIGDGPGIIRIRTWADDTLSYISVKDDGCGISKEQIGKIFDPFFTTKDVGKGTGLGLSVSHDIIKAHGGKIEVSSVLGQGTEFIISLPIEPSLMTVDPAPVEVVGA